MYSLKGAKSPPIIGLVYSCDLASCSFSSILFVKISAFKKAAKMWVDKKGEDNHPIAPLNNGIVYNVKTNSYESVMEAIPEILSCHIFAFTTR